MTRGRIAALALLTFGLMLPVTLPVPVLRGLVLERFGVGDARATWFMAVNMAGALLAAPAFGALADRTGRRRAPAIAAILADAACMQLLTRAPDFTTLLALRAVEGAAHIGALSLVLSLVADRAGERRGRVLGALGAGLTLGVATGAAVGGALGRDRPEATLHVASAVLLAVALLAALALPPDVRGSAHRADLRTLARLMMRGRGLVVPLALSAADRFTVGFFTAGFPLMLQGVHGVSPARIGILLALFLYPFAVLSYPVGKLAERWSRVRLVAGGSILYGTATMTVGVVEPGWLWGLMPLLGLASAAMFVPTLLLVVERAPDLGRSTAIAAFNAAGSLGFLLGPLACSALVATAAEPAHGYALAFAAAGACEIACVALLLLGSRAR